MCTIYEFIVKSLCRSEKALTIHPYSFMTLASFMLSLFPYRARFLSSSDFLVFLESRQYLENRTLVSANQHIRRAERDSTIRRKKKPSTQLIKVFISHEKCTKGNKYKTARPSPMFY